MRTVIGRCFATSRATGHCPSCQSALPGLEPEQRSLVPGGFRVYVGGRVRMVWPSALEGQTGVVASANDTRQVVTVRIDGARWRGRGPVHVSRDEVEPVAEVSGRDAARAAHAAGADRRYPR